MLELTRVLHHAQEGVLGDIFCGLRAFDLAVDKVVNRALVAVHNLGERCTVATLVAHHEHFIGCVAAAAPHVVIPTLPRARLSSPLWRLGRPKDLPRSGSMTDSR